MGEPYRQRADQQASHGRACPTRQAGARLQIIGDVIGKKQTPHEQHGNQTANKTQQQEGGQFHIELQRPLLSEAELCHIPKANPADHRACNARNHDRGKGMHGEMAQHHLQRKERASNRRVERGRHCSSNGTPQKIAPGDTIGLDPVTDPCGDNPRKMHHRALSPR